MKTNRSKDCNYNEYEFSKAEWFKHLAIGLFYFAGMGFIFYQHVGFSLLLMMGVVYYMKEQKKLAIGKRKILLRDQFREAIYALSSSLSSGRSLEQAFFQSLNDLKILYDASSDIVVEWEWIVHKISNNEMVETALTDFARRADLEDIHNFANVFVMAKRSGGDLIRIIKDLTRTINEKIEIQKDIDVLVTQKKYEQKLLSFIIPGMILFFSVTSPDFLGPLYETVMGRYIMTFALGLYLVSDQIGKKIVTIEV